MRHRLRTRLLIIVFLAVLPPAALLMYSIESRHQSEIAQAGTKALAQTQHVADQLRQMIENGRRVLANLSADPQVRSGNLSAMSERMISLSSIFPYTRGIALVGLDGRVIAPVAPETARLVVADRAWFKTTVESRQTYIGDFVFSRVTGRPSVPLATPFFSRDGTMSGVLALGIDVHWIVGEISEAGLPQGAVVSLLGKDDMVLLRYPDSEGFVGKIFQDAPLIGAVHSRRKTLMEIQGLDQVIRVYSILPFVIEEEFRGSLAIGLPASSVFEESNQLRNWSLAGLTLVLALSLGLAMIGLRRSVLVPVEKLAHTAARIGQGDLGLQVGPIGAPAELVSLTAALDRMSMDLALQRKELDSHRSHLEELVTRRTLELTRSNTELQRSNQELQQFAYVASHDLQEPLRMVVSFTQLLGQKYGGSLDEKAREYIAYAVDGAVRMQQLINDLLDFSRVDSRGTELVEVLSQDCFEQARANLNLALTRAGAVVEGSGLPLVKADRSQLTQVFQNLILNGVKFNTSQPPRVRVSAELVEHSWRFCVADNGIGIDPQFQERVFVIFQRLNTRQEFPGTGIGLAICKRVVERHGGTIWFDQEPTGGTRFWFTLPAHTTTGGSHES